jgi:hypothetical protein
LGLVSGTFGVVDDRVDEQSVFEALGTEVTSAKTNALIVKKLAAKNMNGRLSTWPIPVSMLTTYAVTEYAIKWISGEAPKEGVDEALLKQCMAVYAGNQCSVRTWGTHAVDEEIADGKYPNWFFVSEDYITY